ncbi:MAG TPA: C1 family peptidase [Archangium sp.]|nr:C1 family peptidase [Archangium sp.]
MANVSVGELKAAIQQKGFQWEPANTPLSALSLPEQRRRLGLKLSDQEVAATARAIEAANALRALRTERAAPPASADWRNNPGNWLTPVKDQGSCGSCVAFSTVAAIEARIRIACKNAGMPVDLSESSLFFCGCENCCDEGWNFNAALGFCAETGIAKEESFPYTPQDQPCKSGLKPYIKINGWSEVLAIEERKSLLASKGPMVGGMAIFQDFYSYGSGIYRHVSGALVGHHAICIVGYDDEEGCWICKNSWGEGFGENGYFRIAYGEALIDTSFAFYDMDVPCPNGEEEEEEEEEEDGEERERDKDAAQYLAALRDVLLEAMENKALRACLRYHLGGKRGTAPKCSETHMKVVRTVLSILAKYPRFQQPFCDVL